MNAPALVLVSPSWPDDVGAQTARDLHDQIARQRPDLNVTVTFVGTGPLDPALLLEPLARSGASEAVVVPLLACGSQFGVGVAAALAQEANHTPAVEVRVSEPLGSHPLLLEALDLRLRAALKRHRVRELDALVLAACGPRDAREAQWLGRVARAWGAQHRLPVTIGNVGGDSPSLAQAIRLHRDQGRRHIAVGSYVIVADTVTTGLRTLAPSQLPAAIGAGASHLVIAEPLGALPIVTQAIMARYAATAIDMLRVPA